jgi:hypothetical protein
MLALPIHLARRQNPDAGISYSTVQRQHPDAGEDHSIPSEMLFFDPPETESLSTLAETQFPFYCSLYYSTEPEAESRYCAHRATNDKIQMLAWLF